MMAVGSRRTPTVIVAGGGPRREGGYVSTKSSSGTRRGTGLGAPKRVEHLEVVVPAEGRFQEFIVVRVAARLNLPLDLDGIGVRVEPLDVVVPIVRVDVRRKFWASEASLQLFEGFGRRQNHTMLGPQSSTCRGFPLGDRAALIRTFVSSTARSLRVIEQLLELLLCQSTLLSRFSHPVKNIFKLSSCLLAG